MQKTSKTTKNSGSTVVFFGTGPVAAKSLQLLSEHQPIEAVITKPKPAHHKGNFPVLDVAEKLGLPVKTVTNKQDLSDLIATRPFKSRLGVLIDFGIIVGQDVIDYFSLGIANSHFSLLPEWRGADPITFAVLSGQKNTGVSLMLLVEKMDEGPLLAYGEYELPEHITTPLLTEHLINFSDAMLKDILPKYLCGQINTPAPQTVTGREVSYSHKLTKGDGVIDWAKPARQIEREIRAFLGWPGSRTELGGKEITITKARVINKTGKPGATAIDGKQLLVYCGEGALAIESLKPAGKNEMSSEAFIAGHKDLLK